jgi:hypothetical protein
VAGSTVLGLPLVDRLVLFVGIPAVVLLVGLAVPPFARWALSWETGLLFRPLFRIAGAIDRPWEVAVNLAIWLAVGAGLAVGAAREAARVTLTPTEVRVDRGGRSERIARSDVAAVFLDGKRLVVLDRESRQVAREPHQARGPVLADAFRAYGYPWQDADPYAALFRRWVPDLPDVPPAVNAVLAAREIALRKKAGTEARELRDAVEKLGFVVRDEGVQQYWRPLVRS